MAMKTTTLNIRIEPDVKEQAEAVFRQLGLSSSIAVNLFLKQVIMQGGMPFDLKARYPHMPAVSGMADLSDEELMAEIRKARRSRKGQKALLSEVVFEGKDKRSKIDSRASVSTASGKVAVKQSQAVQAETSAKPSVRKPVISTIESYEDEGARMEAWVKAHDYEGI